MKRLLTLLLALICAGQLAAQVSPATQAVDCKGTATINVSVGGALYYATVTGGLVILDGGVEKSLLVSSASSINVRAASGEGTVIITLASNPSAEVGHAAVTIKPLTVGDIGGSGVSNGIACIPAQGQATYSVAAVPGASYLWRVIQGGQYTRIVSGGDANSVTVESTSEGNSALAVYVYNDCTGDLCNSVIRSIQIKKIFSLAANETFGGPACRDASVLGADNILVYSVKPYLGLYNTHDDYAWTLSAGLEELYRSADGSSISVRVNDATVDQQVSIKVGASCNSNNILTKQLVAPAPAPTFDATSYCVADVVGSEATFSVTNNPEGKYSYQWVLPDNWTIVSSNGPDQTSVRIRFNTSGTGNIVVVSSRDGCGTKFSSISVNRYPSVAPAIAGPTCVAFGATSPITYSVQGGTNTYKWEVLPASAGWTVTTGNGSAIDIIPAFGNIPASGEVEVRATIEGNCGTAPVTSSLKVKVGPGNPGAIGTTDIPVATCVPFGTSSVTYTIPAVDRADSYQWDIPPTWTVTGVTNTTSITVNPNNTDGTLGVIAKGCTGATSSGKTELIVTVGPAVPGTITGPACVAYGSGSITYSIAAVAKATSYVWEVAPGWASSVSADKLSVTVTPTNNASGYVKVKAIGCSESAFKQLDITVGPPQPGIITGLSCINVAGNQTYSVTPVANDGAGYQWSFVSTTGTGWTLTNGAVPSSVVVTPGSAGSTATLSVKALGCSAATNSAARTIILNVAPAQPGPITYYVGGETSNVCIGKGAGQVVNFSTSAVTGATSYTWTFPWGGTTTTTGPSVASVTDATSVGDVTVVANGNASCNSAGTTVTIARGGLDFCIDIVPIGGQFNFYSIDPNSITNGTVTYVKWFVGSASSATIEGPAEFDCPAKNTSGNIRVELTDANTCKTIFTIAASSTPGIPLCNTVAPAPGARMAFDTASETGRLAAEQEESVERLQLFPNPASDEINVKLPSAARSADITIQSVSGKQIEKISGAKKNMKLNVQNYQDGVYFMIINTGSELFYGKFIVKH